MKRRFCLLGLLFVEYCAYPAAFINLDFEGVILSLPEPDRISGTVPAALAAPGWQVPVNGYDESDTVLYNNWFLSLAGVSLYSRSYAPFAVIQGNFSVQVYSGLVSPPETGSSSG